MLKYGPDGTLNRIIGRDKGMRRHKDIWGHLYGMVAELWMWFDRACNDLEHLLEDSLIEGYVDSKDSQNLLQVEEKGEIDRLRLPDAPIRFRVCEVLRPTLFELKLPGAESILKDFGSWTDCFV